MAFKEFTPEEWLDQLEQGLEYRRRFGLEDVWGELESVYYNVHGSMSNAGPNILLSQGDAILSMLSVPSPHVSVKPNSPESVRPAPLLETLDNTLVEELRLVEEIETASLNAYLFGTGIVKVGYDSEYGYDNELDIGGSLRLGITLSQLASNGKRQIEYDANVQPGMPWAKSVMPHDIVLPWGVRDIDTTPWIAHRLIRHVDDLKADRKYENTRFLQGQTSMRDFVESYRTTLRPMFRNVTSQNPDYIEFFEIHDRRTGKIYAVTWDHNKFLRNDINLLQIDNKLPFAAISFTPRTRSFWTTPDAYYLLHVQNELSDVAIQRTKQRRLSVLKFLYDGGAISDSELAKILSPDVGAAAKIESGRDITKAIQKLDNNPSNQGFVMEEELLRSNAREQIGFSRNQLGEYTGGRKTASEVNAVERSSQLRMSRRGLQAKRLYEDVIKLVNGVVFKHWTLGRYVAVLGPDQTQAWLRVNGPALQGRYSYKVDFVDDNEMQGRKLQALQLYSMLSQDPSVDPLELREFLVDQVNDPAFGRLFNANIRAGMQQQGMQAPNGGASPNNNGATSIMPQMPPTNGQTGFSPMQRLLAGRRNHP